jgi:hypothetical protein
MLPLGVALKLEFQLLNKAFWLLYLLAHSKMFTYTFIAIERSGRSL